jgi:hypothetical protein
MSHREVRGSREQVHTDVELELQVSVLKNFLVTHAAAE